MDQYIRVTSRSTAADGKTTEQIIELGRQQPNIPALGLLLELGRAAAPGAPAAAAEADTAGDAEDLVPGDAQDMSEALAKVSAELGCPNNLDDMLHAIDGLRASAPAKLEWSGTLCDGKRVDYETAEKACAALGEGWRLPTRAELESILDLSRHSPAADPERFPDMKSDWYWSSTPCAWSSALAWCVDFNLGGVSYGRRDNGGAFVRAVRAVPAGQ